MEYQIDVYMHIYVYISVYLEVISGRGHSGVRTFYSADLVWLAACYHVVDSMDKAITAALSRGGSMNRSTHYTRIHIVDTALSTQSAV